jgi:hypothetical protein
MSEKAKVKKQKIENCKIFLTVISLLEFAGFLFCDN